MRQIIEQISAVLVDHREANTFNFYIISDGLDIISREPKSPNDDQQRRNNENRKLCVFRFLLRYLKSCIVVALPVVCKKFCCERKSIFLQSSSVTRWKEFSENFLAKLWHFFHTKQTFNFIFSRLRCLNVCRFYVHFFSCKMRNFNKVTLWAFALQIHQNHPFTSFSFSFMFYVNFSGARGKKFGFEVLML